MATIRRLMNSGPFSRYRQNSVGVFLLIILVVFAIWNSLKHLHVTEKLEENVQICQQDLHKVNLEVLQLKSILKRHNVPEVDYLSQSFPTIHVITPTHARPEQEAELTRLKNVFLHVPALHWILVEDSPHKTSLVSSFLEKSFINSTHLYKETPKSMKLKDKDPRWKKPRGVLQRNEGIQWLRKNLNVPSIDVVYFADDDNTYSIELFEEMRNTNKVSVWPVGLSGGTLVEKPKIGPSNKVIGWDVAWAPTRRFATDMAGFAVSALLLVSRPSVEFSIYSRIGLLETDFLSSLVNLQDLEPKADLCTKVLVWHTQTKELKRRRRKG